MIMPESTGTLAGDYVPPVGTLPANPPTTASVPPPPREAVPGYEIEAELGRGGMGVVYKARHIALNRPVALKMILSGSHAGAAEVARFRTETEAVASLDHPGIVKVFEVGEAGGLPWCALEYCVGGTLAGQLNRSPQPSREAARLVEALARAVQHAHAHNIVHRDLKPANVLIASDGTLKVTDFGLARQLDSDSELTASGAIMGTPAYMAPEQARGEMKRVGPAADIWALGVILYEALTGQTPFGGGAVQATLARLLNDEPVRPSRLVRGVPRDLETIVLKCLAKDPAGRYASAEALADDLRRWQDGEPIQARPVGRAERALKWVRRNPAVTALLALVSILLVGGATATGVLAVRANANALAALSEAERADGEARAASLARDEANSRAEAERQAKVDAEEHRREAEAARRLADESAYFAQIGRADSELSAGRKGRAAAILAETRWDLRGWEYGLLKRRAEGESLVIQAFAPGLAEEKMPSFAFSEDGASIVLLGADAKAWNLATGEPIAEIPAIRQSEALPELSRPPDKPNLYFRAITPSWVRSPRLIALGDSKIGRAFVGPVSEYPNLESFDPPGNELHDFHAMDFSPDGKRLALASHKGVAFVLDAESRKLELTLKGHGGCLRSVAFSPDGLLLATASEDRTVRLWDAPTGNLLREFSGHLAMVRRARFSPDGYRLVSLSADGTIRVWFPHRPVDGIPINASTQLVEGMAFNPDGSQLATTSRDSTVRVFDVSAGKEFARLAGHRGPPHRVRFSDDGQYLASASHDQTVRIWDP